MKHLRYLVLVMALVPGLLSGQEATIEITGMAYGTIAGIGHECPMREQAGGYRMDGYVGMQVSCPVWAIDSQDGFTPSTINVQVNDSSRLSAVVVHPTPDTLGNYSADTLKIQILRPGNWRLTVNAKPILFVMGATTRPASATWPQYEYPPVMNFVLNEVFTLCAYQGGYGVDATAKSYARPTPCPDLGGTPLPEFEVQWTLPDILEDWDPNAVPTTRMVLLQQRPDLWGAIHLNKTLHGVPLVAVTQ